jgi:SNF2 family DNA or RNA helicase
VQALAHIAREKEHGRLDRPCLVLCPTSVLPNWLAEIERLTPSITVVALHGADRARRFALAQSADMVLSTYPLLAKDGQFLRSIQWHAVILDEAQAIKNSHTLAAQAVLQLDSRYRLCLTGTPIENHLGELWSQFNFLIPGLLGTKTTFDRMFRDPIERGNSAERLQLLLSRIRPFLLRRTKAQVATDLPPKTEMVKYVELEGRQRDLYETVRLSMHKQVLEEVKKKGLASCGLIILDALMKLRQTCCHPGLVRLAAARGIENSAKLQYLMEMLDQLLEEKRQILVFSQFTSMLDLIASELSTRAIPFVQLRGDTKDRATPVKRFQNGEVPIFLISLKAGGTGLNLTAADTVIHFDPWWNPAVEDQATDRAHRIGQDKAVFVYRLIASGTIEERMLELQQEKRAIAESILGDREGGGNGDYASLPQIDEATLAALFAPLPQANESEVIC